MKKLNFKISLLSLFVSTTLVAACSTSDIKVAEHKLTLTGTQVPILNKKTWQQRVQIPAEKLEATYIVNLKVSTQADYASLSLMSGEQVLIDNLDVPSKGQHQLNALIKFSQTGEQTLKLVARSGAVQLQSLELTPYEGPALAQFKDISQQVGLNTEVTYKYGGPSVADINRDGRYDFVLNNHNHVPTQLVMQQTDGSVDIQRLFKASLDFHGSATADYDGDGDLDIMVAKGGANGTSPSSYVLLRNDNGRFIDVSNEAGIKEPARGRSPRFLDMNDDGLLDIMLVNAKTPKYQGPQHLFYQNNGDGTFTYTRVDGIENAYAERVLLTDFNRDGLDDVLLFSPLSLWQNNGDFTFTDKSAQWLPKDAKGILNVITASEMDVNNDGMYDIYLARGNTHYQLSRKSIDFSPEKARLDIRDDGERGSTQVSFKAANSIRLSDMELTYRQYNGGYPIYLGKNKQRYDVKAKGFQPSQLPDEMKTAPDHLTIEPQMASGWPETIDKNGLYIGHIGEDQWKAEWYRDKNVYWTVTFSLTGLDEVNYDWKANNRNKQDVLLINQGDKYTTAGQQWNLPKGGDHWGVTHGDVNNDGFTDVFIYRYGFLKERIADLLLLNSGDGHFNTYTGHNAWFKDDPGHGDMGQIFDFNLDGQLDILSGSEEEGPWKLYQNKSNNKNTYSLIQVGYSPKGIDPMSAQVIIQSTDGRGWVKRIGSAGESFSQGQLDIVHFGLGNTNKIKQVEVRWRSGEKIVKKGLDVNRLYNTDTW
ncbi:FG-GAP-like repeat-containing protein [Gayadomonas joobiniege]|uniref:FG-GAP-like repeat-containing protein n=1 Tax=Gayadomonas joobiniege TaxID=1234606 RepID=UPI00036473D4|nr:FG-GAP-like repeat-containing protein [Gayadomonas joobiniege]